MPPRDPQFAGPGPRSEIFGTNSIFRLFNAQVPPRQDAGPGGARESAMGAGFFLMAIMGCADGSAACTPVATMPTRYESRAACAAATNGALANSTDFDFPTIIAECRAAASPSADGQRAPAKRPASLPLDARQG